MKLKFYPSLKYQNDAINSVIDLFAGIENKNSSFDLNEHLLFNASGSGNQIVNNDYLNIIQNNLNEIQKRNDLKPTKINFENDLVFDIEMETGTGKTYVFLKTILKLNEQYGFNKFCIVVPSIAIKEGVLKTLDITKEAFKFEFNNINYNFFEYDSDNLSNIREFSTSNTIQIMIINIQSFVKKENIFNNYNESLSGNKPIFMVSNTRPIIIIDEPQTTANTEKSQESIKNLNPLFILRYSATFNKRNNEHLIYKLDSIQAQKQKLVKKIEVYGQQIENDITTKILLTNIDVKNQKVKIKYLNDKCQTKESWIKLGFDIYDYSHREEHRNLYIEYFDENEVDLSNGEKLYIKEYSEIDELEIKKKQIEQTIKIHLDKQLKLKKYNVKVLSLFFIDRVDKFRQYDENNKEIVGEYAKIFEETFLNVASKDKYKSLFKDKNLNLLVKQIYGGYFSIDKKNNRIKSSNERPNKDDKDAFKLIMKDKEKLLSFNEPLSFIFSHSALKEGWDNPNVFQICTLNDTNSIMKKRQQIGRGLRLCVNQEGERVDEYEINLLSVIANESFEKFVTDLQNELIDDGVIRREFNIYSFVNKGCAIYEDLSKKVFNSLKEEDFLNNENQPTEKCINDKTNLRNLLKNTGINENGIDYVLETLDQSKTIEYIKNANRKKSNTTYKEIINSKQFNNLWNKICKKRSYYVNFDTTKFIKDCVLEINESLEKIDKKQIVTKKGNVDFNNIKNIKNSRSTISSSKFLREDQTNKVDILQLINNISNTNLIKKSTIIDLIIKSNIINHINSKSSFLYIEKILNQAIGNVLDKLLINNIDYYDTDEKYDIKMLNEEYLNDIYLDDKNIVDIEEKCKQNDKYPFRFIKCQSNVENQFALDCLSSDQIDKFIKLPPSFVVDTPRGNYNPDWALINDNSISFIVETKGSDDEMQLRISEKFKIDCGKKYFEKINFLVSSNLNDALLKLETNKENIKEKNKVKV